MKVSQPLILATMISQVIMISLWSQLRFKRCLVSSGVTRQAEAEVWRLKSMYTVQFLTISLVVTYSEDLTRVQTIIHSRYLLRCCASVYRAVYSYSRAPIPAARARYHKYFYLYIIHTFARVYVDENFWRNGMLFLPEPWGISNSHFPARSNRRSIIRYLHRRVVRVIIHRMCFYDSFLFYAFVPTWRRVFSSFLSVGLFFELVPSAFDSYPSLARFLPPSSLAVIANNPAVNDFYIFIWVMQNEILLYYEVIDSVASNLIFRAGTTWQIFLFQIATLSQFQEYFDPDKTNDKFITSR